jgi:hypothetical protein
VCICDCGKRVTFSRKVLTDKHHNSRISCGCAPRLSSGISTALRSWEEAVKYKMNCILNNSSWAGSCLVWKGAHDVNGYPRMSFLDRGCLVKDFLWFIENYKPIGNFRVIHTCGNRSCINKEHFILEPYARRNTTIDRLLETSKDRGKQESHPISQENSLA